MKHWIKFRHWLIKHVVGDYPVIMNVHLESADGCSIRLLPGLGNSYVANCHFGGVAIGPIGYKRPDPIELDEVYEYLCPLNVSSAHD